MEHQLFDGAYDLDDPGEVEFPVYGAFDSPPLGVPVVGGLPIGH